MTRTIKPRTSPQSQRLLSKRGEPPGCLDFVQAADALEPGRISIYERWESDADLDGFRYAGGFDIETPAVRSAEVHKYRIAAVEEP